MTLAKEIQKVLPLDNEARSKANLLGAMPQSEIRAAIQHGLRGEKAHLEAILLKHGISVTKENQEKVD